MVRVKICGITNLPDARAALGCGADALGFVFAKSPRRLTPKRAQEIIGKLGPFVTTVGVFVNENPRKVEMIARLCGLSAVQLHGDETRAYTKKLRCCKVIKAFRVDEGFHLENLLGFPADAYLFDTQVTGRYGGSGQNFNWKMLSAEISKVTGDAERGAHFLQGKHLQKMGSRSGRTRDLRDRLKPVIISGGLRPSNVRKAIQTLSPYGVDVSSGVEKRPGIKDHELLKEFIQNARSA